MHRAAPKRSSYDLVVAGAGRRRPGRAWRAAQAGLSVLVVERDASGAGASGVAAGMLAPVTEADFGEHDLLALNVEGRALWPGFAAELEELTGLSGRIRRLGRLVVAADRDDAAELRRLHEYQRERGPGGRVAHAARGARRWSRGSHRASAARSSCPTTARWSRARWWPPWTPRCAPRAASWLDGTEVAGLTGDAERVTGVRTAAGEEIAAGHVLVACRRLERAGAVAAEPARARGAAGEGPAAGAARAPRADSRPPRAWSERRAATSSAAPTGAWSSAPRPRSGASTRP